MENRGNREFIETSARNSSFPQHWECCCAAGNSSAATAGCQTLGNASVAFRSGDFTWFHSTLIPVFIQDIRTRFLPGTTAAEFRALSSGPAASQSSHPSSWNSSLSDTLSPHVMQRKEKRELRYSKLPSSVNSDLKPSLQTRSGQTFN